MISKDYVWVKICACLERQLGETIVSAWLEDAEVLEYNEKQLILYSPSELRRNTIQEKLAPYIESILQRDYSSEASVAVWSEKERSAVVPESESADPFTTRYTFDRFVVGGCNSFAYRAARAVAAAPGGCYNPLYIFGPSGTGKHICCMQLRRKSDV